MSKNPHKALEAIELLVGGDFGLDMQWVSSKSNGKYLEANPSLVAGVSYGAKDTNGILLEKTTTKH